MTNNSKIKGRERKGFTFHLSPFPLLLLLLIAPRTIQAQTDTLLYGYQFSTGVDSTRWITLHNPTYYNNRLAGRPNTEIGFDFHFFGKPVSQISASWNGPLYFDQDYSSEVTEPLSFSESNYRKRAPLMLPFGNFPTVSREGYRYAFQLLGTRGSRVLVIEYAFNTDTNYHTPTRWMQVQLREADGSITFVYGKKYDNAPIQVQLGLMGDLSTFIVVDQRTHTASTTAEWFTSGRMWPGQWRYYKFTPSPCRKPEILQAMATSTTSTRVSWRLPGGNNRFRVEYDTAGFTPGTGHDTTVTGHECLLEGLDRQTPYDIYVSTYCADSKMDTTALLHYTIDCDLDGNEPYRIPYWNLYGEGVTCHTGSFNHPDAHGSACLDHGPSSYLSRHTVHTNPNETDGNTNDQLHTVPDGLCRSVRLGNWNNGRQQESIEYTLSVDTNDYDLLVLQYAIVENNPDHEDDEQPYFSFGLYDTLGTLTDSCYYANFVAGNFEGWHTIHTGMGDDVVWHDWQAIGMDLSPLHGQTIRVRLSNADCAFSVHFGYGYFTLRGTNKNIRMHHCGETIGNTLYAPKHFSYRWYRADDPATTLSNADSLHVTESNTYCCDVTYQLQNKSCGFTIKAYTGPRYPAAAFTPQYLTPCHSRVYFNNESFVAHDSTHTLISNEPCEAYLWDFGDGTTSTQINPTHRYAPGNYTVRLYAMVGEGQCIDSTSTTLSVTFWRDTLYDTICPGGLYYAGDTVITDTGTYTYFDDCALRLLHLAHYDSTHYEWHDTVCEGQSRPFFNTFCTQAGYYEYQSPLGGCDTTAQLWLSVRPFPDTLSDPTPLCSDGGYYRVALADTLLYQWTALPHTAGLPTTPFMGSLYPEGLRLSPQTTTTYYVTTDFPSGHSCPLHDTLRLEPIEATIALLEVSPSYLWEEKPTLTAVDKSEISRRREWYVNDHLQPELRRRLTYTYQPDDDTVRLMLAIFNETCNDTAYAQVPVRRRELWFPNVFTPDKSSNNLFRGYGVDMVDYELQVYDRWGNLLFSTHNLEEGWDGTWNGIRCPQKSYAYRCTYTTITDDRRSLLGTVTLLR